MKKKLLPLLSLLTICGLCFSCGVTFADHHVIIDISNSNSNGKIYTPKEVTITETHHSLESKRFYNTQVLPSVGDVNILVIPILLPGYEKIYINSDTVDDKALIRQDIEKVFFGESEDTGYESVSSFYKKSSYGKLNINGKVTNWFDVKAKLGYQNAAEIDVPETYDLVNAAIEWVKGTQDIDLTDYDNDKDGYIDGVWCIYSCPNYQNGGPNTDYGNYWAYTSWGNQVPSDGYEPNVNNPVYNLFGWASYDFMYGAYDDGRLDAHTYIHEMGHFLGLNDYYSDQLTYSPLGRIDMMDSNVIDHNSYSKMLLGWTKPYLVTGPGKIQLYSMENKNQFIVIPDDSYSCKNGEFDPFSEYILIELYTNDHLNYLDSVDPLYERPAAPTESGVRIYHIDNRKFYTDFTNEYDVKIKEYAGEVIDDTHKIFLPITNYRGANEYNYILGFDHSYNLYDEIRLIEATNVDTFSFGGYQKAKSYFNNQTFDLNTYGKNFFYNENVFNNGKSFSYQIKVGEVK